MNTPLVKSINFKILLLVVATELAVFIPLGLFYTSRFTKQINAHIEQQLSVPGALMRDGTLNYTAVSDTFTMATLLGESYIDGFIVGVDRTVYYAHKARQVETILDTVDHQAFWSYFDSTRTGSQICRLSGRSNDIISITPLRRHGDNGLLGFLYIHISAEASLNQKNRTALLFSVGSLVCILVTTIALFYLLRRTITQPVNRVAHAMQRFTQGDFTTRTLRTRTNDEIAELENGFNTMAGNLEKTVNEMALNEQKYRNLVERLNDGLLVIDGNGAILYANPRISAMLGVDSGQLAGRLVVDFIAQESQPIFREFLNAEESVQGKRFECVLQAPHGTTQTLMSAGGSTMHTAASRQISLVITDITESKRLEAEREQTARLDSIGQLAGGIAHDFNNMLTAIICNLSMIESAKNDGDRQQYIASATKASNRASDLTRQLLTFSKGGQPVRRMADIGALIRESVTISLSGSAIKCESDIPAVLRLCMVDAGQISQVLNNLLINAKQAMPEGGFIFVRAENILCGDHGLYPVSAGDYVRITVSDTGSGIRAEDLPRIFDPFFTTKSSGNGLGLASAYSIIRKHSGHIMVESKPGSGTTFTVLLPSLSSGTTQTAANADMAVPRGQGRILLFDDDQAILQAVTVGLMASGYVVEPLTNGIQAVARFTEAYARNQPFVAVILDLTVPGGFGGKKVLAELKKIDPRVRSIVASGYSNDPVLADFRAYGFDAMIQKPFTIAGLLQTLSSVLNAV